MNLGIVIGVLFLIAGGLGASQMVDGRIAWVLVGIAGLLMLL